MKKRSLILSTALLLVAIMACTSATYAWFTNSKTATVTDITASVAQQSSLLISGAASAPAAGSTDWKSTLAQGDLATLATPVTLLDRSSVDGSAFFSRSVDEETNEVTFAEDSTGVIVFTLHFISSAGGELIVTDHKLASTKLAQEAARVAFICEGNTIIWEPSQGTTVSNDGYKSSSTGADGTRVMAINDTNGGTAEQVQTLASLSDSDVITTLEANVAKTVTVKIWLEGQDAQCANAITGANVVTSYQFGLAA